MLLYERENTRFLQWNRNNAARGFYKIQQRSFGNRLLAYLQIKIFLGAQFDTVWIDVNEDIRCFAIHDQVNLVEIKTGWFLCLFLNACASFVQRLEADLKVL